MNTFCRNATEIVCAVCYLSAIGFCIVGAIAAFLHPAIGMAAIVVGFCAFCLGKISAIVGGHDE